MYMVTVSMTVCACVSLSACASIVRSQTLTLPPLRPSLAPLSLAPLPPSSPSVKPATRDPLGKHSGEELILHFLAVPAKLERFLAYGTVLALDGFLDVFTFLPLRCLRSLGMLLWDLLNCARPRDARKYLFHRSDAYVLLRGFLFLICCYVLEFVDMSFVYHYMKSQTFIKLYVMFNMLDMLDKLCAALGQDILDALYTTCRFFKMKDIFKMTIMIVFSIIYLVMHSLLNFVRMVALNVVCNSSNASLRTWWCALQTETQRCRDKRHGDTSIQT